MKYKFKLQDFEGVEAEANYREKKKTFAKWVFDQGEISGLNGGWISII
jgi:hypothetical protein